MPNGSMSGAEMKYGVMSSSAQPWQTERCTSRSMSTLPPRPTAAPSMARMPCVEPPVRKKQSSAPKYRAAAISAPRIGPSPR